MNKERSRMHCIYTAVVLYGIVRVLWFCKYEKDCLTYHHVVYESTDMYIILFWAYGSIALNFMGIPNQERTHIKDREDCYPGSLLQRHRAKGQDLASQIIASILPTTTTTTKKKKLVHETLEVPYINLQKFISLFRNKIILVIMLLNIIILYIVKWYGVGCIFYMWFPRFIYYIL